MPDNTTSAGTSGNPDQDLKNDPTAVDGQGKDLLNRVTESAHQAVDRMAEKAGPAVHKLESGMAHANETLTEQAQHMRELGDEWTHILRDTVRENPLTAILLAVTAGALIARITAR
ncbi:MAG TPA: hypothetical protein VFY22_07325 [Hydrogenophaga sp.]|nr:hypothetical protein [Hydrogenophaga sp.]